KIILLVRGNDKYPTARERFDHEIALATIFDRLKEEKPSFFRQFCKEKIECITGELTQKNFGLNKEEFSELSGRIDMVIHVAASVDFREQLQKALKINTLCLLNLADLVKAAGNIPMVHVSTCFVNGFNTGDCHEEVVVPVTRGFKRNSK